MKNDGRALTESETRRIEHDVVLGLYNDHDIARLFQTFYLQRKILRILFNLFRQEPLRLVSVADPVRNSTLAHYKELVSMQDGTAEFY